MPKQPTVKVGVELVDLHAEISARDEAIRKLQNELLKAQETIEETTRILHGELMQEEHSFDIFNSPVPRAVHAHAVAMLHTILDRARLTPYREEKAPF